MLFQHCCTSVIAGLPSKKKISVIKIAEKTTLHSVPGDGRGGGGGGVAHFLGKHHVGQDVFEALVEDGVQLFGYLRVCAWDQVLWGPRLGKAGLP